MKVFIVAFLAAAASASPLWLQPTVYNAGYHPSVYNTGLPVVGSPLVHHPVASYYQPLVKPVVPVQYVKEDKVNVEKTQEDQVKVYKSEDVKPIVYGNPFYQPIQHVQYKQEIPAQYHSKSAGGVEHQVNKREAIYPYGTPYMTSLAAPYTSYATPFTTYAHQPYTQYTGMPYVQAVAPQPQVVPQVTYTKPEIKSNAKTIANDAINPFGYANKGEYVADSEGALHIAKRDADAQLLAYNTHMTAPVMYSGMYNTHFAAAPVSYTHQFPAAMPTMYGLPQYKVKSYSNDAVKPEDYASKGQYHAETEGSIHIAKRDAEADPLVYTHPLSLSTYAVGSAYQTPFVHRTVPYAHRSVYNRAFYPYY